MPLSRVLNELILSTPGAIGAVFLDFEGEAVAMFSDRPFDADDHDLKVMGAYQGIFLAHLRELCERVGAGAPHRFKVEFAEAKVLSCDLKDGYYLVFLVDKTANEAIAWRHLVNCGEKLLAEI